MGVAVLGSFVCAVYVSTICMLNFNLLAFIVPEISPFVRMLKIDIDRNRVIITSQSSHISKDYVITVGIATFYLVYTF